MIASHDDVRLNDGNKAIGLTHGRIPGQGQGILPDCQIRRRSGFGVNPVDGAPLGESGTHGPVLCRPGIQVVKTLSRRFSYD